MGKIIDLAALRNEKNNSLTKLLKQATLLKKRECDFSKNPKDFFHREISGILIERKLIKTSYFVCGFYVANILTRALTSVPDSWYITDYLIKAEEVQSPEIIKECADTCFIAAAALNSPRIRFFNDMGTMLFFRFYELTKKDVGFYMGENYQTMVEVASNCIDNLKTKPA